MSVIKIAIEELLYFFEFVLSEMLAKLKLLPTNKREWKRIIMIKDFVRF